MLGNYSQNPGDFNKHIHLDERMSDSQLLLQTFSGFSDYDIIFGLNIHESN